MGRTSDRVSDSMDRVTGNAEWVPRTRAMSLRRLCPLSLGNAFDPSTKDTTTSLLIILQTTTTIRHMTHFYHVPHNPIPSIHYIPRDSIIAAQHHQHQYPTQSLPPPALLHLQYTLHHTSFSISKILGMRALIHGRPRPRSFDKGTWSGSTNYLSFLSPLADLLKFGSSLIANADTH